jgi:hypothetical protein
MKFKKREVLGVLLSIFLPLTGLGHGIVHTLTNHVLLSRRIGFTCTSDHSSIQNLRWSGPPPRIGLHACTPRPPAHFP